MAKNSFIAEITFNKELLIVYLLNLHQGNRYGAPGVVVVITYINVSYTLTKQKQRHR